MTTRIIIPTRHEAPNIRRLVSEIGDYAPEAQIYFVDDSDTLETVEAIEQTKDEFPWLSIGYLFRQGADRTGGIVGAVKAGMQLARLEGIESVIVMDGDGQHDPVGLPMMIEQLRYSDVVPGSRNIAGGTRDGLDGPLRQLLSWGATWTAKWLFPQLLAQVSDPMSGMFGVRLGKINVEAIRANGFKVLLEIMLTHPGLSVTEVPVRFRDRFDGESKADMSVGRDFARQLVQRRREIPAGFALKERKLQFENV